MALVNIVETSGMPSMGRLIGSPMDMSALEEYNQSRGSGVLLSDPSNPYLEKYRNFTNEVLAVREQATDMLGNTIAMCEGYQNLAAITDESHFRKGIPENMWVPILTHNTFRNLLEDEAIYGFGIDASDLPEEDVYRRLINNGRITSGGYDKPQYFHSQFRTGDPDMSFDDLRAIEETREFMEEWLGHEMKHGESRDPTDFPHGRIRTFKQ